MRLSGVADADSRNKGEVCLLFHSRLAFHLRTVAKNRIKPSFSIIDMYLHINYCIVDFDLTYSNQTMSKSRQSRRKFLRGAAAGAVILAGDPLVGAGSRPAVKITETKDTLGVEINGRLFTAYNYKNVPKPYFYPVIGPTGDVVVRHWPMKKGAKYEQHDHAHHRSWWFAHEPVNGHDFWTEGKKSGKIVHDEFIEVRSGETGVIACRNKWVSADRRIVCTDTREHEFSAVEDGIFAGFRITIHASHGDVLFGDSKEGTMAIRVAPQLRLKGKVAAGHIINSEGVCDGDAWGAKAAWCDYWGEIGTKTAGIAIFDHPDNLRHPTGWHARSYGLFAANPFGAHYFQQEHKGAGDYRIKTGESLVLKYGFYFHVGSPEQAGVAEHYQRYAKPDDRRKKKQSQ